MEFAFDIDTALPGENSICSVTPSLKVTILEERKNSRTIKKSNWCSQDVPAIDSTKKLDCLLNIIDCLGEASSKAQCLHSPITTGQKLQISDHILFIKKEEEASQGNGKSSVVGFLKVGPKRLFVVDENGELHERIPLCILDFYIHESKQRRGYGKELFEAMLKLKNIAPQHLAIDRPSSKFVAFLQKHYNLKDIINQANNFVVFRGFFRDNTSSVKPASNQRHSYCGAAEYNKKSHPVLRPHSLGGGGGVESCFMWNRCSAEKSPSLASTSSSATSQISLKSDPPSFRSNNGKSAAQQQQRNQRCSSWNVFGVDAPEYRNVEKQTENQFQKLKQCNTNR